MKLLIWDFDGTLGYQKRGFFSDTVMHLIRELDPQTRVTVEQIRLQLRSGFPWQAPEQSHLDITSADQWWEELYPLFQRAFESAEFDTALAAGCARRVRAVYTDPQYWALYEDTLPVLERLASLGWSHAILSNHVPELAEIVRQLDLDRYLEAIFCSAQIGYEKPNPQAFKIVTAAFPEADPVWMIGDNHSADFTGARERGLRAILVRKPYPGIQPFAIDLKAVEQILEQDAN